MHRSGLSNPRDLVCRSVFDQHVTYAASSQTHSLLRSGQPIYSSLMCSAFTLPASTAHWICTLVSGQVPFQQLIILEFVRFWARLGCSAQYNSVLKDCLFLQCSLSLGLRVHPGCLSGPRLYTGYNQRCWIVWGICPIGPQQFLSRVIANLLYAVGWMLLRTCCPALVTLGQLNLANIGK